MGINEISENTITAFNNEHFGKVRMLKTKSGAEMFCGVDVATALGYKHASNAIYTHCKHAVKETVISDVQNQYGSKVGFRGMSMMFIPESDVMRLIVSSALPSADAFESWIFEEILPSIRKFGGYVDSAEQFVNSYLDGLSGKSKALYINMLNAAKNEAQLALEREQVIEEQKPAVAFSNAVSADADDMEIGDFAKLIYHETGINIGRNKLWAWLRSNGYVDKKDFPYQMYLKAGYFNIVEVRTQKYYAEMRRKVMLTGKGQTFFHKKLLEQFKTDIKKDA